MATSSFGALFWGFVLGFIVLNSKTHGFQVTLNTTNLTSTATPNNTTAPTHASSTRQITSTEPATPILPNMGHFILSNNGMGCLLLDLDCDVTVVYDTSIEIITYHVLSNAKASGTCSSDKNMKSKVTLSWSIRVTNLNLTMGFSQNQKEWTMDLVEFNANDNGKPLILNITDVTARTNITSVAGSKGYSYLCDKTSTVPLGHGNVKVTFNRIHVQPFTGDFGKAVNCEKKPGNEIDNVVPLAVGCALGVLVIILFIAYCVGRGRGHGYEHM